MNKEAAKQGGNTAKTNKWEGFGAKTAHKEMLTTAHDNKSARAILYGPKTLFERDTSIKEEERNLALDRISSGEFTIKNESDALKKIASNLQIEGADKVETRIKKAKEGKWLLENIAPETVSNKNKAPKVTSILNRYPTPIEFESREKDIISHIQRYLPEQLPQYKTALNFLKKDIYGKRLDYHESFVRLREAAKLREHVKSEREAAKKQLEKKQKVGKIAIKIASEEPARAPELAVKYHTLSEKEKKSIEDKAILNGDPVTYMGKEYTVNKDFYKNNDLRPEFSIKSGNQEIFFSKVFEQSLRPSVIGYVPNKDGYKMVSYYRSNSQGDWRLLPDYISDPNNKKTMSSHFGKGYGEESLCLSESFAAHLDRAMEEKSPNLVPLQAQMAFLATAKKYNGNKDYANAIKNLSGMKGEYYKEVNAKPTISSFQTPVKSQTPPSELDITGQFSPDFTKKLTTRKAKTGKYGLVTIDTYPSENGEFIYKFCENEKHQAQLCGVEIVRSENTSDGLKKAWVDFGDLMTPLLEHRKMVADKYSTEVDETTDYVSTWEKYLSKSPLINRYLASKNA